MGGTIVATHNERLWQVFLAEDKEIIQKNKLFH